MLRSASLCLEPSNRRVHVRDAVVRRDNVERRTKVNVPVNNKMKFTSGRIARIVRRIIYVCVATVDGSDPISGATEIAPDITNITFFHRMENTAYPRIFILR